MKTEIKIEAGRVHLIYRGEDYGSYPVRIISFEKKAVSTLLIKICESHLLPEMMANVLVNGVQLTPENFKELLYDNLTNPSGPPATAPVLTVTPMHKAGFDYLGMVEFQVYLDIVGINLTRDIVLNVSNPDGDYPVGYHVTGSHPWDNRTGGRQIVYATGDNVALAALTDVVSIDAQTATINIEMRNP
jgi:hypothetical protein